MCNTVWGLKCGRKENEARRAPGSKQGTRRRTSIDDSDEMPMLARARQRLSGTCFLFHSKFWGPLLKILGRFLRVLKDPKKKEKKNICSHNGRFFHRSVILFFFHFWGKVQGIPNEENQRKMEDFGKIKNESSTIQSQKRIYFQSCILSIILSYL